VITALVDDELAPVWSDDTALGGSSEALALTDGKAISRSAISCLDQLLGSGAAGRDAGRVPPSPISCLDQLLGSSSTHRDRVTGSVALRDGYCVELSRSS
jgi:hypothetical protein